MSDYKHESRSRDRGFSGGRGSDRQMHDAVCSNCGKKCRVPFRPTNGKPIYCSDCFEKMGGRSEGGRSNDRRPDRGAPRGGDTNSDISAQRRIEDRGIKQLTEKIETLNNKLDKIISLMILSSEPKAEPEEKKTEKKIKKSSKSTTKKGK